MDWLRHGMKRWGGEGNRNDPLRAVRSLSRKKVECACLDKLCEEPWEVYRGKLKDKDVFVHVLGPDDNVTDVARQMSSISNRHVAKVIGWCADSRSIVVEGGEEIESLGLHSHWKDCCRIAQEMASAAVYLASQSGGVKIDYKLVFCYCYFTVKLVYIPGGSDSATHSFGRFLKELLKGPLQCFNAISADDLNDYLTTVSSAMIELDQVADICGSKEDPSSMEEIAAKITNIVRIAHEKMEDGLRGIRTLSRKQVEDARQNFAPCIDMRFFHCYTPFTGTLEGAPVVVFVMKHYLNVAAMAWQMHSLSHPHVAKVIGWCEESRNIVVEGGNGLSLKDRISKGLGCQDCCQIANQVWLAALYLGKRGISVQIVSELIRFDDNKDSKLVYLPTKSSVNECYYFGRMLREMLVGPWLYEYVTSQDALKANLYPHVKGWPKDVIEELTRLTAKCLIVDQMELSMENVAEEMDHIGNLALAVKQTGSAFSDDIWLISAKEIAVATANFSSSNRIGVGGFGEVFKGRHKGTAIAVKKLLPGKASKNFEQEILLLNRLRHPHILSLIGFEPSGPCLVSEYMSGGSLQDYLQGTGGAVTWEDIVRISREMASAVAYMHSRGVVHRDLKPVNVLLDDGKRSKICDMGLAKLCEGNQVNMSGMQGTYGYMDPYTVKTGLVGPYSDTYALGLIILQLLTGLKHIRDVHNFLSQHEKQVIVNFRLGIESVMEDSTTVEILTKQSSSSTGSEESFVARSGSRWEEDSDALNDIIEHFCLKLDPRSSAMPKVALQKTVGFLLRCLERQWEYRPNLDDFLFALEELEGLASKKDLEKSDISTHGKFDPLESGEHGEGSQLAEEEKETDERLKYLSEESSRLKAELEILVATQQKRRQVLADVQEGAKTSKIKLSELQQEMSTSASLQNFEDLTRLCEDVKLLGQVMKEEKEKETELQMELNVLEMKITENKTMAVDVDKALEKVREPVMALCESLRAQALEKQQEIEIALKGSDLEKVMSLAKEATAANEKANKLQKKYGFDMTKV